MIRTAEAVPRSHEPEVEVTVNKALINKTDKKSGKKIAENLKTSQKNISEPLSEPTVTVRGQRLKTQLMRVGASTAREHLEEMGAWGTTSGGAGSRLEIQLRGAGGHQSGLYLDQIPLHSIRGQATDLTLIPLDFLEAVSVESGGDGTQNGSGALGGQVQLMTAQIPQGELHRMIMGGSSQGWGRVSTLWGYRNPNPTSESHQMKRLGGMIGVSLSGGPNRFSYRDRSGYSQRRVQSGFNQFATFGKGELQFRDHKLSMNLGMSTLDRDEPGPEGFTLLGRESSQELFWGSATEEWHHSSKARTIQAKLSLNYLRLNYLFSETVALWQSSADGSVKFLDQRISGYGIYSWSSKTLTIGSRLEISSTQATTQQSKANRIRGSLSPYLNLSLGSHSKLKLATRVDMSTERSPQFVSNVQFTWSPSHQLYLWLGWSEVWRDPGFDERMMSGPGLVANPHLKPESGQWGEVGGRMLQRTRVSQAEVRGEISLRAFSQDYDDLITYIPLDPYRIRAENITDAHILGLEGGFKLTLRMNLWSAQLQGVGSKLRHQTLQDPQAPLPLRPQTFGQLKTSLSFRTSNGEISSWLKLNGRGSVTSDRFGERKLPQRVLWSLGIQRVWRSLTQGQVNIALSLYNLFNQSSYDFVLSPLPGRSAWLTLTWSK